MGNFPSPLLLRWWEPSPPAPEQLLAEVHQEFLEQGLGPISLPPPQMLALFFFPQPGESPPTPLPQEGLGPGCGPTSAPAELVAVWLARSDPPRANPHCPAGAAAAPRERAGCSCPAALRGCVLAGVEDPSRRQQGPSSDVHHPCEAQAPGCHGRGVWEVPSDRTQSL